MASTSGVNLAISGLASGFDWQTMVTQLAQAERSPESVWQKNQAKINSQNSAYTILKSYLSQLQSDVQALKSPALYDNRSAQSSAASVATAASTSGGATGTFKFNISQLATAASLTGGGNVSSGISSDGNMNAITVGAANFATAVTAGSFSVNGAQVSIATTDSLQSVFDKIKTATGNAVTATYDQNTDKITLSSASAITLGSAADTSNFLQVAKLYNNATGAVTSLDKLGRVNTGATLTHADLKVPITGDGSFAINGVTINYKAATDTVQSVMDSINSSAAGVTASYDATNNRFTLANKTTGDVGISVQDLSGNFLAATALTGSGASGTFLRGTASTATMQTGATGTGLLISPSSDVNATTVATANFATAVTAGNFTVNGAQVNIAGSDSLQTVFDNIAAATGNTVTASYDATSDKITFTSTTGAVTLGDPGDTSNFLQAAKLSSSATGTATSADKLGRVNTAATLAGAGFKTPVSGSGSFVINGATINYNAGTDTVQSVLNNITSSAAGVTASYDSTNNQFVLTNKAVGSTGISMQDVSGNFLAAAGFSSGSFTRGTNLNYTINDGQTLVSQSNTIDPSSSGITGLSVSVQAAGTSTITVGNDTSALNTTLNSFLSHYNSVESYIDTNAASTTDSTGKVTAGTLTGDMSAADLATRMRSNFFSPVSNPALSATLSQLAGLGFTSNGQNNSVTLDSTTLNNVLTNHLSDVKKLFSDTTNGLAVKLDTFLTNTIGDTGTLTAHQTALTKQSTSIDTQIANLEKQIATDSDFWTKEFQNMETAQSQLSQQLSALNQQITNGTL